MSCTFIVPRLNELNQQLTTISKLRKMEDESRENSSINLDRKVCHCAHHKISAVDHCTKCGRIRIPRHLNTCKKRRRFCYCKTGKNSEEELQTAENTEVDKIKSFQEQAIVKETEAGQIEDFSNRQDAIIQTVDSENRREEVEKNDRGTGNQEISDGNENSFERIQKDLLNERKRTKELEEKLKNVKCDLECLKNNGEQRTACLQLALQKAEEQAQSAAKSRDLALSIARESKDELESLKSHKEQMLNKITDQKEQLNDLMRKNSSLTSEREGLKHKLRIASENETKICAELAREMQKITLAVKHKENVLQKERDELKRMVAELTNMTRMQKKRVSELSCICDKQKISLQEKNTILSKKDGELRDIEGKIEGVNCECKGLKSEIEKLTRSLDEKDKTCENFKRELTCLQEKTSCKMKVKDKIIEDQQETIKKQKKLLENSQRVVQQFECEFTQLRNELYCKNREYDILRDDFDTLETRLNDEYSAQCVNLETELECLRQQKEEASLTAKLALQKITDVTNNFQRQLNCEKRQNQFLSLMLWKRKEELQCLQHEVLYSRNVTN